MRVSCPVRALAVVLLLTLVPFVSPGAAVECPTLLDDWCDSIVPPAQILHDATANPSDTFGAAIHVDGDRFIVGVPGERDATGACKGAAVVYQGGPGLAVPAPLARLEAPSATWCSGFGSSVALRGDIAVVGEPWADQVHVFERNSFGEWPRVLTILRDQDCPAYGFGFSLVLAADLLFVGGSSGSGVCTFERDATTGRWAPDEVIWDNHGSWDFGRSAAFADGLFVAGAPTSYNPVSGDYTGLVQVFRRDAPDNPWYTLATIGSQDLSSGAEFGASLAWDSERLVVGAPSDSDPFYEWGSAYVFDYDAVSGDWTQSARVLAPPEGDSWRFGESVALLSGRLLVGAPAGTDHLYDGRVFSFQHDATSGTWIALDELAPLGGGDGGESFGSTLRFFGQGALVGAPGEAFGAVPGQASDYTGGVYVYSVLV